VPLTPEQRARESIDRLLRRAVALGSEACQVFLIVWHWQDKFIKSAKLLSDAGGTRWHTRAGGRARHADDRGLDR
jgi:hypothetical protein